ncbi:hypothetical protein I3760_11G075200 [Carya illinoinensis]|nr:hypothetical protein I3760_11G075200 [Carya illinoinensis]
MGAANLESFQITIWSSTPHAVPDFRGALFISRGNGWPLKPSSYKGRISLLIPIPTDLSFSLFFTAVIFFWRIGWCHLQVHVR